MHNYASIELNNGLRKHSENCCNLNFGHLFLNFKEEQKIHSKRRQDYPRLDGIFSFSPQKKTT
jgi:hypothetical protein